MEPTRSGAFPLREIPWGRRSSGKLSPCWACRRRSRWREGFCPRQAGRRSIWRPESYNLRAGRLIRYRCFLKMSATSAGLPTTDLVELPLGQLDVLFLAGLEKGIGGRRLPLRCFLAHGKSSISASCWSFLILASQCCKSALHSPNGAARV
jgi:hypothetical protein